MFTKTQIMRYLLLFVILGSIEMRADFPQLLKIKANSGKAELSDVLDFGKKYRITVTGEYSIWSEQLANGLDAAYVYDVPSSVLERDAWPAERYVNTTTTPPDTFPGYKLPMWVGDTMSFPYNPFLTQEFPLFQFNLGKWTGFRINGEPIAKTPYRNTDHQYQFERTGDGKALSFAIIDSIYEVSPEPAPKGDYANNSGELQVLIEVVEDYNVNICSADPILDINGNMQAIRIDVSVLVIDSNKATGKRNILFDEKQVAILDNGKFACPDSIRCNKNVEGVSIGMLFDRSGSMGARVSNEDTTPRIDAGVKSVKSFIGKLAPTDEALLVSFSDASDINIDADWTSDKTKLSTSVNTYDKRLNVGSKTALHSALITAISRTKINSRNRIKAIVALSDGANNVEPLDEQAVISTLPASRNIPIFMIALGMDTVANNTLTDPTEKEIDSLLVVENKRGLQKMKVIAEASGGRLFLITNSNALDSTYAMINRDIREEECCSIYYKVDSCQKNSADTVRNITVYYPYKGGITAKTTSYKTSCAKTFLSKRESGDELYTKIISSKRSSKGIAPSFPLTLPKASSVKVEIIDAAGNIVRSMTMKNMKKGANTVMISPDGMATGMYTAKIFVKGKLLSQHELLIQE